MSRLPFVLMRYVSYLGLLFGLQMSVAEDRPNILWIVSEDNGPFLGCYGDVNALTPHLDGLAAKGIRYTNAFANTPVCAPARSSWLFGVPAVTTATFHMRSNYQVPRERFMTYPEVLRAAGYYTTNCAKTDYNTSSVDPADIWDASSKRAHYKDRPEGMPFFAVFNLGKPTRAEFSLRILNPRRDCPQMRSCCLLIRWRPPRCSMIGSVTTTK